MRLTGNMLVPEHATSVRHGFVHALADGWHRL